MPGMACAELEFAVRSLGFPVNYEEVQERPPFWAVWGLERDLGSGFWCLEFRLRGFFEKFRDFGVQSFEVVGRLYL